MDAVANLRVARGANVSPRLRKVTLRRKMQVRLRSGAASRIYETEGRM
jgi:hypothetical protein